VDRSKPFEPQPISFLPQLVERTWGGHGLSRYGKRCGPGALVGESWEVSDVEGMPSVLDGGPYSGKTIRDLMASYSSEVLGAARAPEHPAGGAQFPLLLKLLDAQEDLSIQVHPSDEDLARSGIRRNGKTEAWIILDAEPGARVWHGLAPGVDRTALFDRLEKLGGGRLPDGEADRLFRWIPVERGDVVFVPAGTIHAVGKGITLLEVQQTSDITYRIYDWGRRDRKTLEPRKLHIAEARGVSEPPRVPCPFRRLNKLPAQPGFVPVISAADCDKLTVECATLAPGSPSGLEVLASTQEARSSRFHILSAFEGEVRVRPQHGAELKLRPGMFVLLPSILGGYSVTAVEPAQVLRFSCGA